MTILHAQAAVCSQDRPHAAQAPCRRQAPSKSLLAVKVNPEMPEAAQTRGCESGAHVYCSFWAEQHLHLGDESLQQTISWCWLMF